MRRKLLFRLATSVHHAVYGLFNSLSNFLVSVLIVRIHSPELWGEFAQYQIALIFFSLFIDWGQKEFLLKKLSHGSSMSLWKTSLGTRSISFILVLPASIFIFNNLEGLMMCLWILAHTFHHSFDSLIVYTRRFTFPLIIEIISFAALIFIILMWGDNMQAIWLINIFAASSFTKGCLLLLFFNKDIFKPARFIKLSYLAESFPFFLPSAIGFLQAKSETFTVAFYLSEKELGQYYLFTNMLSYCQLSVLMLFAPYKKNVYRFNSHIIRKIALRSFLVGIFWSIAGLIAVHFTLTNIYLFVLKPAHYVMGFLIILPYFCYFIQLYHFFSKNPMYVIITLAGAAVLNFSLSLLLVPAYGIDGALIANASGQWLCVALFQYFITSKSEKKQGGKINEPLWQRVN